MEKKKDNKDNKKSKQTVPGDRPGKTGTTDPSKDTQPRYHYTDAL